MFCNLFKALSLFINFIPSINILSVEEARMAETSTWIKDLLRKKFASSSVYSTYIYMYMNISSVKLVYLTMNSQEEDPEDAMSPRKFVV